MRCALPLLRLGALWLSLVGCLPLQAADDDRGADLFARWELTHAAEVRPLRDYLAREGLHDVAPLHELLRSASMWRECRSEPFAVPPPQHWPEMKQVLQLMKELRRRGILGRFEVVSGYRGEALNRCAGGSRGSSHMRFAVDVAPLAREQAVALCQFWRKEGERWAMGLSRYPTGRVHIDRGGYRSWGRDYTRGSSFCNEVK